MLKYVFAIATVSYLACHASGGGFGNLVIGDQDKKATTGAQQPAGGAAQPAGGSTGEQAPKK